MIRWRELVSIARFGLFAKKTIQIKIERPTNTKIERNILDFIYMINSNGNRNYVVIKTKHIKGKSKEIYASLVKFHEENKSDELDIIEHLIVDAL